MSITSLCVDVLFVSMFHLFHLCRCVDVSLYVIIYLQPPHTTYFKGVGVWGCCLRRCVIYVAYLVNCVVCVDVFRLFVFVL